MFICQDCSHRAIPEGNKEMCTSDLQHMLSMEEANMRDEKEELVAKQDKGQRTGTGAGSSVRCGEEKKSCLQKMMMEEKDDMVRIEEQIMAHQALSPIIKEDLTPLKQERARPTSGLQTPVRGHLHQMQSLEEVHEGWRESLENLSVASANDMIGESEVHKTAATSALVPNSNDGTSASLSQKFDDEQRHRLELQVLAVQVTDLLQERGNSKTLILSLEARLVAVAPEMEKNRAREREHLDVKGERDAAHRTIEDMHAQLRVIKEAEQNKSSDNVRDASLQSSLHFSASSDSPEPSQLETLSARERSSLSNSSEGHVKEAQDMPQELQALKAKHAFLYHDYTALQTLHSAQLQQLQELQHSAEESTRSKCTSLQLGEAQTEQSQDSTTIRELQTRNELQQTAQDAQHQEMVALHLKYDLLHTDYITLQNTHATTFTNISRTSHTLSTLHFSAKTLQPASLQLQEPVYHAGTDESLPHTLTHHSSTTWQLPAHQANLTHKQADLWSSVSSQTGITYIHTCIHTCIHTHAYTHIST